MEMWELFIKGLAKTFEDFARKMIEKGKELDETQAQTDINEDKHASASIRQEKSAPRKRVITHKDLGDLEDQILAIIGPSTDGMTLKDVASKMNMQWHMLRIPFRQLTQEGKLVKDEKTYTTASNLGNERKKGGDVEIPFVPAPSKTISPDLPSTQETPPKETPEAKESQVPKRVQSKEAPVEPEESTAKASPRRRVVDARELEKKTESEMAASTLSIRDKERLRYRILTALRGRPEGLNLEKLAAVLGMEIAMITPILDELRNETKVILVENEKYRLP